MQPSTYFKQTGLAQPQREALRWLAGQLRWERRLADLREERRAPERKAA